MDELFKISEDLEKIIALSIIVFIICSVPILVLIIIGLIFLDIRYIIRLILFRDVLNLLFIIIISISIIFVGFILSRVLLWLKK